MRRTLFSLVAVAVLVVSGCMSAQDSGSDEQTVRVAGKPAEAALVKAWDGRLNHTIASIESISVAAKDGTILNGHIYLPDKEGPLATVLEYSPYFNSHTTATDQHVQVVDGKQTMTGNHRPLLEAGFAVALINIRGTGTSGGCIHWGPSLDWEDAYAVIETLAEQPWSNGNVGMVGTSYPGWTQFMALAAKPPSLKAVIPVSGVIDLHSLLSRNGATLSIGPIVTTQWHALYSLGEATYLPTQDRGGEFKHLDCGPRVAEDAHESAMLYAVGDRNAYWDARDLRQALRESDVPIFLTNGLTDGEGHILQVEGLWESLQHENKRMMLGQWGHGGTAHASGDWPFMRVAWFDQWLRDGPEQLEVNIVEYQDDSGEWHVTDTWPPAGVDSTLFLSDGTIVSDEKSVLPSLQAFQSAHANPCPGVCADYLVQAPKVPACGPHQALYVSPPLQEDVFIAGNFHVNLTITSTMPNGNFAVFLYRTTGDGQCPDPAVVEVRRALSSLRHAQAPGHPGEDFPVGTPANVNLVSHPFASPLKKGERLVLAVGGSALELTPEARMPVIAVETGGSAQAQITVTVVDGALTFA